MAIMNWDTDQEIALETLELNQFLHNALKTWEHKVLLKLLDVQMSQLVKTKQRLLLNVGCRSPCLIDIHHKLCCPRALPGEFSIPKLQWLL